MNVLITNANVYTVDPAQPRATAIAIANDRIVAVGSDAEIDAVRLPGAARFDMRGAFILPGMIDAHLHLMWTGMAMQRVDVFEAPSVREAVERVRARSAQTPRGQWIQGHGWMQSLWSGQFPTAADLDEATREHPVALAAKSGHALWANSLALQMAGITAQTADPEGGQFVRDASGSPSGVLLENAMAMLNNLIPLPASGQEEEATVLAMSAMNRVGLTGAHCMDGGNGISSFRAYERLREQGRLTLRIVKQLPVEELDAVVKAGIRSGFGDAWLRIGGIKLFADGALGPRTAAMLAPYEGEPDNRGISTFEREALFETVMKCNANGLAAVIHAIGDSANHDVLDAFEVSARQSPDLKGRVRNRIEHAQILHPADIARFAQLGVIASVQPIHATQDMLMADAYWGRRSANAYATRALRDAGARLAFGSDSPVETFDPLAGMHAAVTRRRADGTPGPDGWYGEQRVTIEDAIRGYTIGAAWAGCMEREVGSLEAGKLADLVVLSRDLTATPPDELLGVRVEHVMVNGEWLV
ncbi:MAG: amidohydrolase [Chloroflexi bacterium]|nr:amidohydrolase [Chloroflexota bacterium]MCL5275572.1 amidohydrolase [Chloroflexota bacterium]